MYHEQKNVSVNPQPRNTKKVQIGEEIRDFQKKIGVQVTDFEGFREENAVISAFRALRLTCPPPDGANTRSKGTCSRFASYCLPEI